MPDKPQYDKFKEAAKDLDCNEDEARFDEKLKRVVDLKKAKDKKK